MRTINGETLRTVSRGFKVLFIAELAVLSALPSRLAMEVPSDSADETYNWLSSLPGMRKWIGDRHIHGIAAKSLTIVNEDFESTIAVDRKEILFDKLALVAPRIKSLAQAYDFHRIELIGTLLKGAFTTACWDGQYFCDTDHPVTKTDGTTVSVSNKGTAALSQQSFLAARSAMRSLKNESDQPLRIVGNVLVVGPQLEGKANELMKADQIEGTSNTTKGMAEVLVVEELADLPTAWFLMDLSRPLKPFILQTVKKGEFVAQDDPSSDNVFNRKEYVYGVDCIDNAGYGLWHLVYGSTGAEA